ncbi:transcription factor BHLH062-like isoform X1 [Miscanthus floridulus]|uniref:transcription factor BHLH062-like isoform X1 n=2 Tax=Miscanthus floridulus TaxID=154761 RepID=UPI00345A80A6
MVAETESSDSLPGSSNAASEMPANGLASKSIHPKKTHKAEREKLKRDQLNDLFVELGSMLDLDRQNTGKATVLGDAARVLRDLITQVESLRKEQCALVSERQYVSSEKNELQEENNSLKSQISELQNELCARMRNSSLNQNSLGMSLPVANTVGDDLATHPMPQQMWSNISNLSSVAMAHPTNTATLLHSQDHSADAGQGYAPQPRELQLFPGASSSPERGCSWLGSDQATSSRLTDSLPGQLCLSLPQSSQEGSSSGVPHSRKERRNGLPTDNT